MKVLKYLCNILYNEDDTLMTLNGHTLFEHIWDSIPIVDEDFKCCMIQKLLLDVGREFIMTKKIKFN